MYLINKIDIKWDRGYSDYLSIIDILGIFFRVCLVCFRSFLFLFRERDILLVMFFILV